MRQSFKKSDKETGSSPEQRRRNRGYHDPYEMASEAPNRNWSTKKRAVAKKMTDSHKYTGRKLTPKESKEKLARMEESAKRLRPLLPPKNPNYGI